MSQGLGFPVASSAAPIVATVAAAEPSAEDWQAAFDERAGHLEYDCHVAHAEAERIALADTIARLGPRPVTVH